MSLRLHMASFKNVAFAPKNRELNTCAGGGLAEREPEGGGGFRPPLRSRKLREIERRGKDHRNAWAVISPMVSGFLLLGQLVTSQVTI